MTTLEQQRIDVGSKINNYMLNHNWNNIKDDGSSKDLLILINCFTGMLELLNEALVIQSQIESTKNN